MTRFIHIFDRILDITLALTCIFIVIMMLIVCLEVVLRYFFNSPTIWSTEIASDLLLYITFLVGAWVLKNERHVKMDMILNRLNPRSQALLNIITSAFGAIICAIIVWFSAKITLTQFQTGYLTQTMMRMPEWPIMGIIPIGAFLLFVQFLRRICYHVMHSAGVKAKAPEQVTISE